MNNFRSDLQGQPLAPDARNSVLEFILQNANRLSSDGSLSEPLTCAPAGHHFWPVTQQVIKIGDGVASVDVERVFATSLLAPCPRCTTRLAQAPGYGVIRAHTLPIDSPKTCDSRVLFAAARTRPNDERAVEYPDSAQLRLTRPLRAGRVHHVSVMS